MADFATERLEPTSRGAPVSPQNQHEIAGKRPARPKAQRRKQSESDSEPESKPTEAGDDASHRLDQLA